MSEDSEKHPSEPARSRAVFSQQDFKLIRAAIAHYLKEVDDKSEIMKYTNLHHRLGARWIGHSPMVGGENHGMKQSRQSLCFILAPLQGNIMLDRV